MENEALNIFFDTVVGQHAVWLLQADDGLFAMTEDQSRKSYLPLYATEQEAKAAATDIWESYQPEKMDLRELINWLGELKEDEMMVGVALDQQGKLLPFEAEQLQEILIKLKKQKA